MRCLLGAKVRGRAGDERQKLPRQIVVRVQVGVGLAALLVQLQGLADHLLGLVQVHVVVGPDVAEVVVVGRLVRLLLEQGLELLAQNHLNDIKLSGPLYPLVEWPTKALENLLRAAIEKSTVRDVRAHATLCLAKIDLALLDEEPPATVN